MPCEATVETDPEDREPTFRDTLLRLVYTCWPLQLRFRRRARSAAADVGQAARPRPVAIPPDILDDQSAGSLNPSCQSCHRDRLSREPSIPLIRLLRGFFIPKIGDVPQRKKLS